MSETAEFWGGEFGDDYHERNRVDWRRRVKFWSEILDITGARSCFEWGCGPGWNLSAIKAAVYTGVSPQYMYNIQAGRGITEVKNSGIQWDVQVAGYDVNESACEQAQAAGLYAFNENPHDPAELVFTVGVLIHVPPDDLQDVMRMLIKQSTDYVLAVEYDSSEPREIDYRGHKGKLWAQPFGELYQRLGLKLVAEGGAGDGFDDCYFWLLRK